MPANAISICDQAASTNLRRLSPKLSRRPPPQWKPPASTTGIKVDLYQYRLAAAGLMLRPQLGRKHGGPADAKFCLPGESPAAFGCDVPGPGTRGFAKGSHVGKERLLGMSCDQKRTRPLSESEVAHFRRACQYPGDDSGSLDRCAYDAAC